MKSLLATLLLAIPAFSQAESFLQAEAGLGIAYTKDLGDGTWYQDGVPHTEHQWTPAIVLGLTGPLYTHGAFDVRYHLDYTYAGEQEASCVCVPDSDYNPHTHTASVPGYIPFNGMGAVQGVSLTVEPGYTWHGYRVGVEGGAWVFWATWQESRFDPTYPTQIDLSHKTTAQASWVVGASISKGPFTLRYRYYNEPQKWNPYPALQTGTHMLMVTYAF